MEPSANIYEDAARAMDGTLAVDMPVGAAVQPVSQAEVAANSNETRITIILPTTAYFMSGVRDFTMSIVKNMTGFPEKWAYRFQSIVDELCNNAIEHGSQPGQEVKVTFISRAGESIFVSVEDSGTGPTQVTTDDMNAIVRERQAAFAANSYTGIRGRGLAQIVSQWTDELKFDNVDGGGLKVSVLKRLDPSELEGLTDSNTLKIN
ncbi:ATP-binding protein [Candidatus Peregrinibacteria bacterium]|jgi:anti-sigma regulatory factor (Ser/Thr protein kinase)|nr:ATP-binding protein [Candidatus Peregrinibacteria bacterium]